MAMCDAISLSVSGQGHSCRHCSKFVLHLFDELTEGCAQKPAWHQPNPSQDQLASILYGDGPCNREQTGLRQWFYRTTNGISFIETSLKEFQTFAQHGCNFARHIVGCLTKDEDVPERHAIGPNFATSYSVELGVCDLDNKRWETLLGPEEDDEPDNLFTVIAQPDMPVMWLSFGSSLKILQQILLQQHFWITNPSTVGQEQPKRWL